MELYDLMKNIRNISKEEEIQKAISKTKYILQDLTTERMCKVYSSFIFDELQKAHITSRIIKTSDFSNGYDHTFVLVPVVPEKEEYYLIDLTFNQFPKEKSGIFLTLETNGYQLVNNNLWYLYLQHITNTKTEICSLDEVFYQSVESENKTLS